MNFFIDELIECDLCVAHNGEFDKNFINATARREGIYPFEWPPMIDTMKTTTNLCQLPVNVYYKPSSLYEVRKDDTAVDIQINEQFR